MFGHRDGGAAWGVPARMAVLRFSKRCGYPPPTALPIPSSGKSLNRDRACSATWRARVRRSARGGAPLHFGTSMGVKQEMLVSIRKFEPSVWRSAWKISIE
jgi:hypothetical protein